MKLLIILPLIGILLLSGCKTNQTAVEQSGVQALSPEQLAVIMQQVERAKVGEEETDKSGRAIHSHVTITINPNKDERAIARFDNETAINSNFAHGGIDELDIEINKIGKIDVDGNENLVVPVGTHIRIGAAASGSGSHITDQINALAGLATAKGEVFKGIAEIDGKNRQVLVDVIGKNKIQGIYTTLQGTREIIGEIVAADPISRVGNLAIQGIDVINDNGETESHQISVPSNLLQNNPTTTQ